MTTKNRRKHYKERLVEITEQEIHKGEIVLVGDCIIEYLDIEKYFPEEHIYNNGIAGDTTLELMKTLYKRAIKYKPKKLFISIGSNDIGFDNRDVKGIYANIQEIVKEVKRRSKETDIHLVSVLPVNPANKEYINREYVDSRDNFDINMLNYYLRNYARKNRLKFVDITRELKNEFDQLCLDYTLDGFHLNDLGYQVVTKTIKKYV